MRNSLTISILVLLPLFFLWGCDNDTSNGDPSGEDPVITDLSCIDCHSSREMLEAALGKAGGSKVLVPNKGDAWVGEVPPLEAWEKVYIAGSNGSEAPFISSLHGPGYEGDVIEHALTCQMCHNGPSDYTFANMTEAHTGIVRDPSTDGEVGCNQCHTPSFVGPTACTYCHPAIAASNANSLHTNLWGEKAAIELRCGCTFDGSSYEDMFTNKCGGCHTTCGQCHISRPDIVGGGFPKLGENSYSAHSFNVQPSTTENCTACHGSRVGTDFSGALEGNLPDVHTTADGGSLQNCVDCHGATEMHGDGLYEGDHYTHRYQVDTMPRCENCHTNLSNNAYHQVHVNAAGRNMQCQVCHSQPYNNCTNCHNLAADEMSDKFDIDPSVVQFKIAKNPSPYRTEYDYVVVRHVPVDPGTYTDWGLELPDYLEEPTWKYTSPHNVLKNTPQTTVADGQWCGATCHSTPDSPEGWWLRESDLRDLGGEQLPDYLANIDFVLPDVAPDLKDFN